MCVGFGPATIDGRDLSCKRIVPVAANLSPFQDRFEGYNSTMISLVVL